MNRSEAINELAASLAKAQGEIEGASKDKKNSHFNSSYADLGAVWDAIREPLTKHGLSVVQMPHRTDNGIDVETTIFHTSGQWISSTLGMPVSKPDAHGFGSAITYARRFALMAAVGVAPVDDDGNAATGKVGGAMAAATNSIDEARREIATQTGSDKSVYRIKAEANAKAWADAAIETLNFANTMEDVEGWWQSNAKALSKLEEKHPDQYERICIASDNAREATKAKAA